MSGKGNLSYGLNARNKRKKGGLTSFGGDDSDGSNSSDGGGAAASSAGARSAINRDIAAEQAALRKRAQAAMAESTLDSNVYDYDAEYDSFSSGKKKEDAARSAAAAAAKAKAQNNEQKAKVQPRYITNLLKTANRRNQEQEIIYERQVAKEQAEEDATLQYEGKEKFITSSYKRKLEEREQWAKEEEERAKREIDEDVTKKKGVGSFMFGGIGRSLLMGNNGDKKSDDGDNSNRKDRGDDTQETSADRGRGNDSNHNDYQRRESSRETERWGNTSNRNRDSRDEFLEQDRPPSSSHDGRGNDGNVTVTAIVNSNKKESTQNAVKTRQQILEERAIKIREARERYFKRRGVVTQ
ncbi:hypothetical protein ACHAXR_000799 [Thalassiosira sp. AJA248-18]